MAETGEIIELPSGEERHVLKVLRGRIGDRFEVVDVRGNLFEAELHGGPRAEILGELDSFGAESAAISLYQAVPKGQRMELVVEKAVELGVLEIFPLTTERSQVAAGENKLRRWRRLAEAAARQSLQLRVPKVHNSVDFPELLRRVDSGGILLHNGDELPALEDAISGEPVALCVGPEGGWSENELDAAERRGFARARLGPHRLRSETAGITAVARTQAAFERSTSNSNT